MKIYFFNLALIVCILYISISFADNKTSTITRASIVPTEPIITTATPKLIENASKSVTGSSINETVTTISLINSTEILMTTENPGKINSTQSNNKNYTISTSTAATTTTTTGSPKEKPYYVVFKVYPPQGLSSLPYDNLFKRLFSVRQIPVPFQYDIVSPCYSRLPIHFRRVACRKQFTPWTKW